MLPAFFAVSLLGDEGMDGEDTVHGGLRPGGEESDCGGRWEGDKNWGRLFADWGGRLNEYCNDLNNFSAQKMLC